MHVVSIIQCDKIAFLKINVHGKSHRSVHHFFKKPRKMTGMYIKYIYFKSNYNSLWLNKKCNSHYLQVVVTSLVISGVCVIVWWGGRVCYI